MTLSIRIGIYLALGVPLAALAAGPFEPEAAMRRAEETYSRADYRAAIVVYDSLLSAGYITGDLLHNLGVAYYRAGELGSATLQFERAHRLAPRDAGIRHNLEVVRAAQADALTPAPEFFLARWWRLVFQSLPAGGWAALGLLLLWSGMGGLIVWLLGRTRRQKKWGFLTGLALLAAAALPFALGASRVAWQKGGDAAVILARECSLRASPDTLGQELRTLREGLTVRLLDQFDEWRKVRLPNGEEGWLPAEAMEII